MDFSYEKIIPYGVSIKHQEKKIMVFVPNTLNEDSINGWFRAVNDHHHMVVGEKQRYNDQLNQYELIADAPINLVNAALYYHYYYFFE